MKKLLLFTCSFILFNSITIYSQTNPPTTKKGTIKIKKKGHLFKIVFDEVNYRLIGIDTYGNIMDSAVVEFTVQTTIKGIAYKANSAGPYLTPEMQYIIDLRDSRTTLFFKNIKAKDRNGTLLNMPDFSYTFPFGEDREY